MPERSIEQLAIVARALADLVDRVVFIGGAVAPLLHVDRLFSAVRATDDVDAVAATTGYAEFGKIVDAVRARGFRESIDAPHLHRWIAPGPHAIPFDLVPVGSHPAGSNNAWGAVAIQTAVTAELEPGLRIRHASAPAFLALKLAAFGDRGAGAPLWSEDLEDILALVASRPRIVEEVAEAPPAMQSFVGSEIAALLRTPNLADVVTAHLNGVVRQRARAVRADTVERLQRLARD